jgi:hypothetical protein
MKATVQFKRPDSGSGKSPQGGYWLTLTPIMLYCADQIGAPIPPTTNGINTKEYLKTAYHDIPLVIPAIREFWMPQRAAEAAR